MLKKLSLIVGALVSLNTAFADEILIKEIETLRRNLSIKDSSRSSISRKLADLYFTESLEVEKKEILQNGVATSPKIVDYRKKSLKLYEEALTGDNGNYQAASGELKVLIQFQQARLYNFLGQKDQAKKIYLSIYESQLTPANVKKESALELADMAETNGQYAEAEKYYSSAIQNCDSFDVCSYSQYRRAWNFYRDGKIDKALEAIKLSLFDSKGQPKEQSLRDYVMFLSNKTDDGQQSLEEVEQLSKKIERPTLINDLAEGYYAAGNKKAGTLVYGYLVEKTPNLYYTTKLVEEYYGFRNWDRFKDMVESLHTYSSDSLKSLDSVKSQEVDKALQRVIVQLDEERRNKQDLSSDLQKVISFYLKLYPQTALRSKMIEGWLTVETDKAIKMDALAKFAQEDEQFGNKESVLKWRKMRLAIAQEVANSAIIMQAAADLEKMSDASEARKYKFIQAQTLYKDQKNEEALAIFTELAKVTSATPDEFAVKSINMALDIYNMKKNFTAMDALAKTYTENEGIKSNPAMAKELEAINKIQQQARFEYAVSLGDSKEALDIFMKFCMEGTFSEKACPNAKVIAVKSKDQATLVTLLEKNNDTDALIAEYELMGDFVKSASLYEKNKLTSSTSIEELLKLAILFELGDDIAGRDRMLKKVAEKAKSSKSLTADQEAILYITFDEANMLNASLLTLPWSTKTKLRLVQTLEDRGNGNDVTRKTVAQSTEFMGAEWARMKLSKIVELQDKQQKISFYGNNSKSKFQQRLNAINALVAESKKTLPGADVKTRLFILNILSSVYLGFAQEISSTPIPNELPEEEKMNYQVALEQMAEPFRNEGEAYLKVYDEQLATITDESKKQEAIAQIKLDVNSFADLYKADTGKKSLAAKIDRSQVTGQLNMLKANPSSKEALNSLMGIYEQNNQKRLASYFKGRLLDLGANL